MNLMFLKMFRSSQVMRSSGYLLFFYKRDTFMMRCFMFLFTVHDEVGEMSKGY